MALTDFEVVRFLGKAMATQDNRGGQYPLYAIQEDKRVWVEWGQDYNERDRVEDTDDINLCPACTDLFEAEKELPADCSQCDPEAFDHYRLDAVLAVEKAGVFFTEVGCQMHIDANSYHYNNPRVYGIGAWRNYEMQSVMRQIITTGEVEIPSHYR